MSAVRSIQRLLTGQITRNLLISPLCICHHPNIPVRKLHTPPISPNKLHDTLIPLRHDRQRREYATIIHNQKYSDDKIPLTLDITPSCAQVYPLNTLSHPQILTIATLQNPSP